MDAVNKECAASDDASVAETSILEISTNNQDDTFSYQTADEENSSKYFSMITDSTVGGSSSADVTLENKSVINDSLSEKVQLLNKLSNAQNKSVDKLQIHEKIDAAKILSGGVDIFDDNENSSDEHGLVIDYDAQVTEAGDTSVLKQNETMEVGSGNETKEADQSKDDTLKSNDEERLIKSGEEEQLLKSAEEELAISSELQESKEGMEEQEQEQKTDNYSALLQSNLPEGSSEVTLVIDDKNVDAIDIGEGVFIYKNDEGELTAIQITVNEDGTTNFKCLHVGKNEDGNLEVYEEQVSQVPVTNEELETMRSQELAKSSNATSVTTTTDANVSKESKGVSSDLPKVKPSEDIKRCADLPRGSSQGDKTSAVVEGTEDQKLGEKPPVKVESPKENSVCVSTNEFPLLQSAGESKSAASVTPSELTSKENNSALDVASAADIVMSDVVKETVKTTAIAEADIVASKPTVNISLDEPIALPAKEENKCNEKEPILLDGNLETEKLEAMEVSNLMNSSEQNNFVEEKVSIPENDLSLSAVKESEKSYIDLPSEVKISKPFLQEDSNAAASSPVNVCGVSTKISDPVLPGEFISDSQDSTSNILSAINNEESSNTVESVVSSCPSINPTDSIMSEQLSINDTLCTKLNENNKILTFEMSNLEFKGESTQSASLSEDASQGESVSKSISDDDLSNDSNIQPLVIEDNSMSQDSVSEVIDIHKDSVGLPAVESVKSVTKTCNIDPEKDVANVDVKSIGESTETSVDSDDDDYVVGEPVTGDSGVEWNSGIQEKPAVDESVKTIDDNKITVPKSDDGKKVENEKECKVETSSENNVSDNNNDVIIKPTQPEKEIPEKSKSSKDVIKEVDFDKFVRRNSVQMFEECIQVDYEDVIETIKTKSVPVLELEYKSAVVESATNNVHVATHKVPVTSVTIHQTSPVMSKSSKSLDEKLLLPNVADKTPSPKKHLLAYKPTYSPVDSNKYMNKAPYSSFSNQMPKHYLPNKVTPTPQSPTQGVRKQDLPNMKPRTYSPVHKSVTHNLVPPAQNAEKTLSFSVLDEKQSPSLSPISPSQRTPPQTSSVTTAVTSDNTSQDSKQCSIGTQVENTAEEIQENKSKMDAEAAEAQKNKNRQPRKQVFTPVTRSDMEIIFPNLYNNAQEYKKETDSKALKLKKEQDLKFKQLSKKEQSKRAERTNKVQNKPLEKIVSPVKSVERNIPKESALLPVKSVERNIPKETPLLPVKSVERNIPKESALLSIPVKSFDKTTVKESSEPSHTAKVNDKSIIKDPSYLSSPTKIPEKVYPDSIQPMGSVKNSNEAVSKDIHLSSPVKSFGAVNIIDSHKVMSPVKNIDTVRDPHISRSSPVKNIDNLRDPHLSRSTPVKNIDTVRDPHVSRSSPVKNIDSLRDPHLSRSSPVKNIDNVRDPHVSRSSPVKNIDTVRDPHISRSSPIKSSHSTIVKESPYLTSPVKSAPCDAKSEKTGGMKPYTIDLPQEKNTSFSNKYTNHRELDNSRLKEYVSPRTYSRFLNKPPIQSVYNQNVELVKPPVKQLETIPKLTEVIENKTTKVSDDVVFKHSVFNKSKEQIGITKNTETVVNRKENTKTDISTNETTLKENVTKSVFNDSPARTDNANIRDKTVNNVNEVIVCKNDKMESPIISNTEEIVKSKTSTESYKHPTNTNVCEKTSTFIRDKPLLEKKSPKDAHVSERTSPKDPHISERTSPKDAQISQKTSPRDSRISDVTPNKMNNTPRNDSPLTESAAKRKRGRPKKIVSDSPVAIRSKESESPVRKLDNVAKMKFTPKDSPKLEEKSRASSISPFGKIDENIKCPICFKTFRTHNVLIKHVKHCNGSIDIETIKTPKKRKLTDLLKSEESTESDKSETDKEKRQDLNVDAKKKNETPDKNQDLSKQKSEIDKTKRKDANLDAKKSSETPDKNIQDLPDQDTKQPKNIVVDSSNSPCTVTHKENDSAMAVDNDKSVIISKEKTLETITLDDSVLTETNSPKVVEKHVKDTIGKKKADEKKTDESSDVSKNVNVKKSKGPVGRPPKDKRLEESKQSSKQTAVASPMSRLAKILNTKPPANAPIACTVCGKTFRQLAHMVYHRSSKHNVEETDVSIETNDADVDVKSKPEVVEPPVESDAILKCEICHKGFRKLHHLVEHREMHVNSETKSRRTSVASVKSEPEAGFRCDTCDKSFRKLHHLVEHRELHTAEVTEQPQVPTTPTKVNQPKPIEDATCPGCGKSFRKRHHMVEHRDVHCSPSKKGKNDEGSTAVDSNIRLSIASSTSDEGNNCGICGKSYRKLHHMVEHRESHAEVREEKAKNKTTEPEHLSTKDIIHECSRCYMVFPNENSLNKHVDICSKKKLIKKSFNFNAQDNESSLVTTVSEPVEQLQPQNTVTSAGADVVKLPDEDSRDNDVVVIEPKDETPKPVEQQASNDKSLKEPTASSSQSSNQNRSLSRKSSDSKDSIKSQKPEKKSLATKEPVVPKSQNVRKSTLTKDTISSKSRKSLISKYPSSSSDDVSVVSRASSLRKSSISSESVSSRMSWKRKSSSSMEYLPLKKPKTKDSSISQPTTHRKSLDTVAKKITKAPNRRSLQDAGGNDEDVKYKLNESEESDIKYKINPEFSKSIKRLSQSSIDVKPIKTTIMKAKGRRSESALSGLKLPKEKVLQTIMEETNVRYSFPRSPKTKIVEPEKPTSSQAAPKKPVVEKQPVVPGRKVVITKKTNIVVANRRKSLGGRKSIDTKKLPGLGKKKLQLRCCSQVFNSQADLAVHRKTHKEVGKVHKCDCGKVFDTEGLLKKHMDVEHTPPKSYKCTLCGASVRTSVQFAKHKRDHEVQQKSQKPPASKKTTESKTSPDKQTKGVKNVPKFNALKTDKTQPGKNKSPVTETRKGVKRKVAHGGVPLSDKMRKAMAGAKF